MRIAVMPGSFDPLTCGHIDLARRAALMFDRVYVVAMFNEKKTYTFSPQERLDILRHDLADIENVTVEFYGGMLYDYLVEKKACAIVKGIRSPEDTEYEILMADYNREHCPTADTILLPPRHGFEKISSSLVKERCRQDLPLEGFVTPRTAALLREKMED